MNGVGPVWNLDKTPHIGIRPTQLWMAPMCQDWALRSCVASAWPPCIRMRPWGPALPQLSPMCWVQALGSCATPAWPHASNLMYKAIGHGAPHRPMRSSTGQMTQHGGPDLAPGLGTEHPHCKVLLVFLQQHLQPSWFKMYWQMPFP